MTTRSLRGRRPLIFRSKRVTHLLGRILLYSVVVIMALWSLFPFLYMLNISLMDTRDVVSAPPKWLPWPPKMGFWQLVLLGPVSAFGATSYKKMGFQSSYPV